MKKCFLLLMGFFLAAQFLFAQDEEQASGNGFKKENLFTGGSVSLSFFYNTFLIGGSPVFGCSITKWADLGIVANYNYTSIRDYSYYGSNDKLHQSVYGGGLFTRLFPVRFIFLQAQEEHNWIQLKYIPAPNSGGLSSTNKTTANSLLLGGGYTTGRDSRGKNMYGYLAILFDVSKNLNSPYTDRTYDSNGNIIGSRSIPIIRAGINIPLFQGKRR